MREKFIAILKSDLYKKIVFILSLLFILLTIFIVFDPQPFIKLGYPGIFVFNIFSSGLFIFPVLIKTYSVITLAIVCSLGMSVNESINWIMGKSSEAIVDKKALEIRVENVIKRYDYLAIFTLALIPFPFDIVGIVAGRLNVTYKKFVLSVFLARMIRYLLYGYVLENYLISN